MNPGNTQKAGSPLARFSKGAFVSVKGGNRIVDAFNASLAPGDHGQTSKQKTGWPLDEFRIVSSQKDPDGNYRWTYFLIRQVKAGTGWDGWKDDPTATQVKGYNRVERGNGDDPSPGNTMSGYVLDINSANGIKPVANDMLISAEAKYCSDGSGNPTIEWWFTMQNELSVACVETDTGGDTGDGGTP